MNIDWKCGSQRALWTALVAAGSAVASCGGGGGSNAPDVSFSFTSSHQDVTEGAGQSSLSVVLHSTIGALKKSASVDVVDTGKGNATSGVDYDAFAPVTVTFPIGAVDGDVQQVPFAANDDHVIEGAVETVKFALKNAVGGVAAGTTTLTAKVADVNFASIQFALAASATPDESTAARSISVQLSIPSGDTLAVAVSARVTDVGGGSATSGVDYSAFAPTIVTFAPGSQDGATQSVVVHVLDDSIIEANETMHLALSTPSAGALIGATSAFQLTITDDDATAASALIANDGPTGVENALAYDTQLDLGSQTVAAGPNTGTLVRITNAGGSPMALGAPSLTGTNPNDFDVVVDSAPLAPPPPPGAAGFVLAPEVPAPFVALSNSSGPGLQVALDPSRLKALNSMQRATLAGFPVPGVGDLTLDLHRVPLPIAPHAVLRVDGVDVPGGLRGAVGDLTTWSGSVLELPGSRVFLALSSVGARGFVELPFAADRLVQLSTETAPGAPGGSNAPVICRILRTPDLAALGSSVPSFACDGERTVPGASPRTPSFANDVAPPTDSLTTSDCKLAIETDYQLFQKFGSTPATTSYVTQLMSAISDQYFTDIQTTLSIAYLGIYSTPADPWTSQDSGGTSSNLLDEFQQSWSSSGWPVQANLAHFISGANLGGGVAYVDVLCNQSFGFGVSGNISGSINWGAWTGAPGNLTWDFVVVAHEIGHNFGSIHTHSFCPPLDLCYANCTGTTVCSQGTLMSYCHLCGGMDNIDLHFHPVCANVMRQTVNSSCLGLSALAGGDYVQYRVRFNPLTAAGARTANLEFSHDAPNETQPFRVRLRGTAN